MSITEQAELSKIPSDFTAADVRHLGNAPIGCCPARE